MGVVSWNIANRGRSLFKTRRFNLDCDVSDTKPVVQQLPNLR